jgi:large subunit ribosomal protein L18
MNHQKKKRKQQIRRSRHVRSKIFGVVDRPRMAVFRSAKHIYVQIIDDLNGTTLVSASSCGKNAQLSGHGGNVKSAATVGKLIAEAAKEKGISSVAFDRRHYRYHGRIKALAESARESGLKF